MNKNQKEIFHVATGEEIRSGRITDVYFARTVEILKSHSINRRVKAEFLLKSFPLAWEWGVLAGVEEAIALLSGLPVNVRSMREGTVFYVDQPVMEIEGDYLDFGMFETCLLGLLCQSSGIATKSARFRMLARDRGILSFGARRMHPALSPMIERSAYIGGADGVSVLKSAEILGEEPVGTIPHALVILLGGTTEAIKAFDEVISTKVRRVALVDTFGDEKFESVLAAETLGEKLHAVRLDTPSSRRGNFLKILEEVRWELDLRGFENVKIIVSGGINEEDIPRLNPLVDAYGIGSSISNAPVMDFSMDIVEVEGKPLAKRGKLSGSKQVLQCRKCGRHTVVPIGKRQKSCSCGGDMEEMLKPQIEDGKLLTSFPRPQDIRDYVIKQLKNLPEPTVRP